MQNCEFQQGENGQSNLHFGSLKAMLQKLLALQNQYKLLRIISLLSLPNVGIGFL